MIKIIKSSYLEDHWKRYPETENALREWIDKIQSIPCENLNDFIQNFPKTVRVTEDVLSFKVTSTVYLLASFNANTLIIRGIGTFYSAFGRFN